MLAIASDVVAVVSAAVTSQRGRDLRRLRRVARDPSCATVSDLELLVRAHGVPELQVWAVVDRLGTGEVSPALAWCWTMEYDGSELAGLCASRMTDREVTAVLESSRVSPTSVAV